MEAPVIKAIVFDCFGVLYIQSYRLKQMIRNQALLDLVQDLRKRYKVGLLSNTSKSTLGRYFSEQERSMLFDAVVLSEEAGAPKPHPEIYRTMLDKLGVRADEVVFVDDDDTNVLSARSVGMHGLCYTDTRTLFTDMKELGVNL